PAPPRATSVPPPPRAVEVVAANWPAAQPAPATQIVAAPLPEPPPRPTQIAAAAPPPELASPLPPLQIAAAPRRYFPSLISQAHAETYRPPNAAAASARGSGRIYVQAGAFSVPENAQRV